tara:strand:- start:216 stop:443 length:228 start_codon:yes stop_codon:yes gene_type:complete
MSQKHTDTKKLAKGIKYLAFTVPLLFLSPYLMSLSFLNKDNFTFYIFLVLGLIIGITAVYLCFKGINTIMKSMFD